jgi:hypothetical protein
MRKTTTLLFVLMMALNLCAQTKVKHPSIVLANDLHVNEALPINQDKTVSLNNIQSTKGADLAISLTGFLGHYFNIPLDQVKTLTTISPCVQATIVNQGADLSEATSTIVTSSFGYTETKALTIPFLANKSEIVDFSPFIITELGTQTFEFSVSAPGDTQNVNDTVRANLIVDSTQLIRDNGDISGYMGLGTGGGDYLGNVFTILSADTLNSVKFYLGEATVLDIVRVDVFIFNDENGVQYLKAKSYDVVVTGQNQEYTAYFNESGVVLQPGKYLFAVREGDNQVKLAYTTTPYVANTAWCKYNGTWYNLGTDFSKPYNHTYYIRPEFGTKIPAFDAEMFKLSTSAYLLKDEKFTVKGTFITNGVQELNSVQLAYAIDGGNPVVMDVTGVAITNKYDFNFKVTESFSQVGEHTIKVYLSNPNGVNDYSQLNDTIASVFIVSDNFPAKKQLFEHFTSSTCGPCASYTPTADALLAKNTDRYSLIRYQVNWPGNGDPYYTSEVGERVSFYGVGSVPSVYRNGTYDMGVDQIGFNNYAKQNTPISIGINASYHTDKTVDVQAIISSLSAVPAGLTVHMAVVEKKTTENISTNGEKEFHNVLMKMLPDADGTSLEALSANKPVIINESYNMSTTNVEEISDLRVVVFVQDDETKEILQSEMVDIIPYTEVNLTFNVDMNGVTINAGAKVYVVGSFNDWATSQVELTDGNADGIYTASVAVSGNMAYEYNYYLNTTVESGNKRSVVVEGTDKTVNDVWSTVATDVNLTFNFDLNGVTIDAGTKVYVAGSFNDWATSQVELTDDNTDKIYTASVVVAGNTTYEYNYYLNNTVESANNRTVVVESTDKTVNDVWSSAIENELSLVEVYPNPFNQTLNLNNLQQVSKVTVTDVLGQKVVGFVVTEDKLSVSTQGMANGVYFVTLTDNKNNQRIVKVVKQ